MVVILFILMNYIALGLGTDFFLVLLGTFIFIIYFGMFSGLAPFDYSFPLNLYILKEVSSLKANKGVVDYFM